MFGLPILSVLTFLPLVGALLILAIRGTPDQVARNARFTALWFTGAVFLLSLGLWNNFDPTKADYQFVQQIPWISDLGLNFTMGVDGISLFFVVLSAFLSLICVIASFHSVHERVREYMVAFLVLETLMIGMFCALDMFLFYVFFEGVLIPMFIIIGVWGGARRVYASFKFFLYTLLGSVLMLVAMIAMYLLAGTANMVELSQFTFPVGMQYWLFLAFFASFAVKVPMWPVHTWLPDAHVEAPTGGSVILAGVLLKMGGYGFLRFSLPMFPDATVFFTPMMFGLSVVAIIYTSLIALAQQDMKKLIAYSSVAHMGFVTMGIFALNTQGVEGAIFQMLSHGIVSAALFLCVGVLYDRIHSREISAYGGVVEKMPLYATAFMIFTFASIGLPGTSGFVGEFLTLVGAFQANKFVAAVATLGVVLGAAYALWLYRRVVMGKIEKPSLLSLRDLHWQETAMFVPMILVVLWMGIYPQSFLKPMAPAVDKLLNEFHADLNRTAAMDTDGVYSCPIPASDDTSIQDI
jgi:NADH-quinone oxidoreductase subunit M